MMSFDQTGRLADMVEIREILEPEIAALAAVRAVERDIEVMDRAVANMDENMADVKSFIRADHEFHLALALATQNISIPKLLDPIVDLLHELRGHIFQVEGAPERGQQHHKRIFEAIRRRDPVSAREAMRAHLSQVRDDTDTASVGG
jgi:GntR family transcriptional repressor for pyruvate dehydrogenase complex